MSEKRKIQRRKEKSFLQMAFNAEKQRAKKACLEEFRNALCMSPFSKCDNDNDRKSALSEVRDRYGKFIIKLMEGEPKLAKKPRKLGVLRASAIIQRVINENPLGEDFISVVNDVVSDMYGESNG